MVDVSREGRHCESFLSAASPLWNGNTEYANFKNNDGKSLVNQTCDANKWTKAADAAKAVIDLMPQGLYKHRVWDTRRWKIAEQTEGGPKTGMNVAAGTLFTDPAFYKRTVFETRVFQKKHYLWPITQSKIERNREMVQKWHTKWALIVLKSFLYTSRKNLALHHPSFKNKQRSSN